MVWWVREKVILGLAIVIELNLPIFLVSLKQELELSMKQLNGMPPLYGQISWSDNRYYSLV